jgi:hypothetical protein
VATDGSGSKRPHAGDQYLPATRAVDRVADPAVVPGVDERTVDDFLPGEGLGQLRQLRSVGTCGESSGHDRRYRQQMGAPGQGKQVAPGLLRLMDPAEQARLLVHQQQHGVARAHRFGAGRIDLCWHELSLHPIDCAAARVVRMG